LEFNIRGEHGEQKFEGWCVVELFGQQQIAGYVSEQVFGGGAFVRVDVPAQQMRTEAASAGFYDSPWGKHPKLQLLTVAELLDGKTVDYPRTAGVNRTYKQAPKNVARVAEHQDLFGPSKPE
jgi:hypothetical protein